jgi:hypothetical protein
MVAAYLNSKDIKNLQKENLSALSDCASRSKTLKRRKRKFHATIKTFGQSIKYFSKTYLISKFLLKFYRNKINFRLARHNIFATYSLFSTSKIIKSRSAGVYKIKCSRRTMKFVLPKFLFKFSELLKKQIQPSSRDTDLSSKKIESKDLDCFNSIIFDIIARKRYRKRIFKKFRLFKKQNSILWVVRSKKCFNGCRVSKKRRKKNIKFRIIR